MGNYKRSSQALTVLPPVTWKTRDWGESVAPPVTGVMKEQLLRQSLELVQGSSNNEEAVRELVERCLEERLYALAFEAMRAFSNDSDFHMCVTVGTIFDLKYFKYLPPTLAPYCESRVLRTKECRSGFGWNNHFTDQRSRALALLGRFNYFQGNVPRALALWDAADDPIDVDEVIVEMCELVAQIDPQSIKHAITLTNYIITATQKAKALARLSRHVD